MQHKRAILTGLIIGGIFAASLALGISTSTIVQNLVITGVKSAPCLSTDGNGLVASTTCGSGGSSSSTLITAGNTFLLVQQVGSNATLTPESVLSVQSSTDFSFSSATGTNITATFLNPTHLTTTTISSVLKSLSATGLATYSTSTGVFNVSSSSLNLSQYLTTSTAATTYYLQTNPSNFISSSTGATLYYPLTGNPTGFITTSTFNLTGTPNYVPLWNASGTALTATSTISNSTGITTISGATNIGGNTNVTGTLSALAGTQGATLNFKDAGYGGGGSPQLLLSTGAGAGSTAGAYMTLKGKLESWIDVVSTNNAVGDTWMRFGNSTNGVIDPNGTFAIQHLNDGASAILNTPLQISNTAPTNSFDMISSGYVGLGIPNPATQLDVNGNITDGGVISSPFLGTDSTGKIIAVTTSTLKGYTDTFGYATSTGIATNTGNWAGTWQGVNSSTFYLATNPSHFISSSTGNGLYLQIANNLSDLNSTSTARTNLGIGATSALALAGSTGIQTSYLGSTNPCASNQAPTTLSALGTLGGCTATFLTTAITSINGDTTAAQIVTSTLPISITTSTGKTTIGLNIGAYLGTSGSNLTVSSTLATSSIAFVISNATTTNNTSSYMEWEIPTAGTLAKIFCKDSVGTTTITFFEPTSYATTTVSSTISSALACGTASNSSTLSTAFSINTPFIVEVTSTVGVPVVTPIQIIYTKL